MRFSYQGVEFAISFTYTWETIPNTKLEGMVTRCWVAKVGVDRTAVLNGTAWCHPSDQFSRATGCKMALTRALAGSFRPFRTAAWKAYWGRKGSMKQSPAAAPS